MKCYTIWLDSEHVKCFVSSGNAKEEAPENVEQHSDKTHGHLAQQRDTALMFKEVSEQLHDAEKILVLGPGQAKSQFVHYLEKHNSHLSKKVVGCEAFEQSTDTHIQEYGKKFFAPFAQSISS